MTYVELFDRNVLENVCTCLSNPPDKVIFLGSGLKEMTAHAKRYEAVFKNRGINVEFIVRSVNRANMEAVVSSLAEIVEEEQECIIDITGGDDVFLFAVGMILERYKDKNVQVHRYNIRSGSILDCDRDGKIMNVSEMPCLSFKENLLLFGGSLYEPENNENNQWEITADFRKDIDLMWKICAKDPRRWNTYANYLSVFELVADQDGDPLEVIVQKSRIKSRCPNIEEDFFVSLRTCGLLTEYSSNKSFIRLRYKNLQVKRCLQKAGQALELKIYVLTSELEEDGKPFYNDVVTGVDIVWAGTEAEEVTGDNVHNEIDVVMMRKMIPVFVSCKNGYFDSEELFKLSSVAEKFGGKYANKLIVTSNDDCSDIIKKRAEDLGIIIVGRIRHITDEKLAEKIRNVSVN